MFLFELTNWREKPRHFDINRMEHRTGWRGKTVRISGYELWKIDKDGLIAESKGR